MAYADDPELGPALERAQYAPGGQTVALDAENWTGPSGSIPSELLNAPVQRPRAPRPEDLQKQQDAWFAQVAPLAAAGDPKAMAAMRAAQNQVVQGYIKAGHSPPNAYMLGTLRSGLMPTAQERETAKAAMPAAERPVSLGQGRRLVNPRTGEMIAEGSPVPEKPFKPTIHFGTDGSVLSTTPEGGIKELRPGVPKPPGKTVGEKTMETADAKTLQGKRVKLRDQLAEAKVAAGTPKGWFGKSQQERDAVVKALNKDLDEVEAKLKSIGAVMTPSIPSATNAPAGKRLMWDPQTGDFK
jgi:hypothetical protein